MSKTDKAFSIFLFVVVVGGILLGLFCLYEATQ
jgi:hypothetical protein